MQTKTKQQKNNKNTNKQKNKKTKNKEQYKTTNTNKQQTTNPAKKDDEKHVVFPWFWRLGTLFRAGLKRAPGPNKHSKTKYFFNGFGDWEPSSEQV